MGSYSGIDRSVIDQLMEIERLPLRQYTTKKTSITQQQNAWKDINTRLNNLFDKLKTLQSESTFTSRKATSTNEDIVSISPSSKVAEGSYKIHIQQLASSTSIIGGRVKIPAGEDGLGNSSSPLKIRGNFAIVNEEGTRIDIDFGEEDSLQDIVDRINSMTSAYTGLDEEGQELEREGSGISASIIDGRLVLTDTKSGDRTIKLIGDGEGSLVNLGLNSAAREVIQGKEAIFTINNVEIRRDSNSISDVVDGLTINLKKVHEEGQYDTVTIGLDYKKAEDAVKAFVDQYNSTMKFIEDKLAAGDPEVPGSKGVLAGDGSLMRLHSSLRNLVTSRLATGEEGFRDISQLGVSTIDKFGQLKFDTDKFAKALTEDPDKVMKFFFHKDEEGNEVGFVARLNSYIDSFISKDNGILKSKNESFEKAIKDLNRRIEDFQARMEKKEEQLIKKFTALDVAMMQGESQMLWLQGQVDAMNASMNAMRNRR